MEHSARFSSALVLSLSVLTVANGSLRADMLSPPERTDADGWERCLEDDCLARMKPWPLPSEVPSKAGTICVHAPDTTSLVNLIHKDGGKAEADGECSKGAKR